MRLDLILYWKMRNYQKVILLNLIMLLWWPIFFYHKKHSKNLFQKLSIFKTESSSSEIWDCQWHIIFSLTSVFTALILLLLFQIIKIRQCCGFNFTILFFFLMATNALATSWLTFSNARIIECSIWFSHGRLMKINSTHVYFRSRIMLYSNDEKQR